MRKAISFFVKLIKFYLLFTFFSLGSLFIFFIAYDFILEKYIKTDLVFIELLVQYLSLCIFLLLYKRDKLSIKYKKINKKNKNKKIIIIQMFTVMLLFLSVFIIEEFVFLKFGFVSLPGKESDPISLLLIWIRVLIIAPIFEEIIFRRITFTYIRENYNMITSSIITSLIFALYHKLNEVAISAFFISILLCVVYFYTEDLFITIWGHMITNASVLIFGYMAKFEAPGIRFDTIIGRFQFDTYILILGFLVFAFCLLFIIYLNSYKQKKYRNL